MSSGLYLDHAASSPLRAESRRAMLAFLDEGPGNASSSHQFGARARRALTAARRQIGEILGVGRDAVIFTGNGSEANLLALVGAVHGLPADRRHVLTSVVEHPSVRDTLRRLQEQGEISLEEVPVDAGGRLDPEDLERRFRDSTGLVSLMWANNELGSLQPIEPVARAARARGITVHSDAAQAVGKIPVALLGSELDWLTFSPHKFGGPQGVGVLLRLSEAPLVSPLSAGRQEGGLRGGTEDVAAIVGTAAALYVAERARASEAVRLTRLRDDLRQRLQAAFPEVVLHSPAAECLPNLVNFSLPPVPGDWLVAALDRRGLAVSHGSACSSLATLPSHVLEAVGADELARTSVRVSFGPETRPSDLDRLVHELQEVRRETKNPL